MLAWVVIYRCHLGHSTPIPSSLGTLRLCVRFSDSSLRHSPLSPIFRILQPLCSPLLRKLPGCVPTIPNAELMPSTLGTIPNPLFPTTYPLCIHILAHSLALFCIAEKLNSFLFRRFRTLCSKYQGVVYPSSSFHVAKRPRIRGRMTLWPSD